MFKDFKVVVERRLGLMSELSHNLFRTDVSKEELWDTYLSSFKPGTNPIHRERTKHDCQCCKSFIRSAGPIVAILEDQLVSIWDVEVGGRYQVVADALSELVKSRAVRDVFVSSEVHLGTDYNRQLLDSGQTKMWEHFHFRLPAKFIKPNIEIGTIMSTSNSGKAVFKRGLDEISVEAVDTVLELIEQNSIYRGEEHKQVVQKFASLKSVYSEVRDCLKDNFCWAVSTADPSTRIRNLINQL